MTTPELLRAVPTERLRPTDGLAITADVWEEAHDYHRQQLRLHALLSHGAGVVTGLEVLASDPPDGSVFILPGIAVDAAGRTIVLPEPRSFDLGRVEGPVYLLLSYGEGRARPRAGAEEESAALYVRAEYGIEASLRPPADGQVELARIRRRGPTAPLTNPADPTQPAANEIDLRFRRPVGAPQTAPWTVAVVYADKAPNDAHRRGLAHLARFLRGPFGGRQPVWVDDDVALTAAGLADYTLIYMVAHAEFSLTADELKGLYAYLQAGGTVLMESCRRPVVEGAPPADVSFRDILASLGVNLEPLRLGHRLFTEPSLFGVPPAGFETKGLTEFRLGGGVVMTTGDYGCVWQGERRGRPALRDEIRSAHEWGANLLAFAAARRQEAAAGRGG